MLTNITLLLAAGTLGALAVLMAVVLGWANRKFHVEGDPKMEAIQAALPGANCGACGYGGCSAYAEAVAKGDADVTGCAPGGDAVAEQLARIMGVELTETLPYRAVIHCSATKEQRLKRNPYHGEQTCEAANLVAGVQGCTYGCLGFGDCERACNYDACHVVNGLSHIDYDACIGCHACAEACPRNIITMVPFKSERMLVVACSNEDAAADVREVCLVGCLGCGACMRAAPGLVTMHGGLPEINYEDYQAGDEALEKVLEKCPRKRMIFVGKPTEEERAAVEEEDVPKAITADFETTVDETEWRG